VSRHCDFVERTEHEVRGLFCVQEWDYGNENPARLRITLRIDEIVSSVSGHTGNGYGSNPIQLKRLPKRTRMRQDRLDFGIGVCGRPLTKK